MNPLVELGVLLGALYLSDCVRVGGAFTFAIRSHFPGTWGASRAFRFAPQHLRGFVAGAPWPPLGVLFVADELPFSVGPKGVAFKPPRDEAYATPDAAWTFVPWSESKRMTRDGTAFLVDGKVVARVATRRAALALHGFLDRAASGDPVKVTKAFLDTRHDTEALAKRAAAFRKQSLVLRIACNLLLSAVLLMIVSLVTTSDPRRWFLAGLVLVTTWVGTLTLAIRAARELPSELRPDRVRRVTQALWPLGLVRAADDLSTEALGDADPLALQVACLKPADVRPALAETMRALRFPLAPEGPGAPEMAADDAWFRAELTKHLERLAERVGDVERPGKQPERDGSSVAWCPRCHAQYASSATACVSCRGVALVAFPKA